MPGLARKPLPDSPATTSSFDCFWRYAAKRQQIYWRRLAGHPPPWTDDPILANYRFTNVYRATDRVSQYLINRVQTGNWSWPDSFARTLLFKVFNRVGTWQAIVAGLGQPDCQQLFNRRLDRILAKQAKAGPIYNPAYIMPPPRQYPGPKWQRHLSLVRGLVRADVGLQIQQSDQLATAFGKLRAWPSIGDFLAYQWLIDLNYSNHLDFDESEFVIAGPGARRGLRKCFRPNSNWTEADLIGWTADRQEAEFAARKLDWTDLGGRRLQLIDVQNLFCEVDKYTRQAPGRRPKQRYRPSPTIMTANFPAKWQLKRLEVLSPSRRRRLAPSNLTSGPSANPGPDRPRPKTDSQT